MNPDANLNLPPPISEAPQPVSAQELPDMPMPSPERPADRPETTANRPATAQPSNAQPQDDIVAIPPTDDGVDDQAGDATSALPEEAADSGTIEKEWVIKAKQIVNQTNDNPFEQNRQLATVKADYLQKRYGKVVKLAE